MRRLICTVGLPRSGKSTWAKSTGFPIVNPDSIRLALHGRDWAPEAEPFVWAIAYAMTEALFLAGSETVILDATMVTRSRRAGWIMRHRKYIEFKVFRTPASVCSARAIKLGQKDLLPVIRRMAKEWDFTPAVEAMYKRRAKRRAARAQ